MTAGSQIETVDALLFRDRLQMLEEAGGDIDALGRRIAQGGLDGGGRLGPGGGGPGGFGGGRGPGGGGGPGGGFGGGFGGRRRTAGDFAHAGRNDRDLQLQEELFAGLSATDFPVWVRADRFRTGANRFYVPLSVAVPGSALLPPGASPPRKGTGPSVLSLDLIGVVRDEAKHAVARLRDTVRVDSAEGVRGKNVQYRTGFTLPPGKYRIKVVARENQGGTFGSFETDISVPDLRRDPVKVSSVVFGTQLEPTPRRETPNPLAREGSGLLPSVTHVVSARQPLYFYYEVCDPARTEGSGVRLLTSVSFFSGGTRRYETPLLEVKPMTAPDRGAAIFQLSVPSASLKPGFYVCQVTLIDDTAGAFTFPAPGPAGPPLDAGREPSQGAPFFLGRRGFAGLFSGSDSAYLTPYPTQRERASSSSRPADPTNTKPFMGRPEKSMTRACGFPMSAS
jgi:hypothetical protein